MEQLIQLKLRPQSSFITPLHADTIWGHLAWSIFHTKGKEQGEAFVEAFKQNPPFVLSDGFPEEYLPKPFTPWDDGIKHAQKIDKKEELDNQKKYKQITYLKREQINSLIQCKTEEEFLDWRDDVVKKAPRNFFAPQVLFKNRIDRNNNQVQAKGGIYEQEEQFAKLQYFSVYIRVFDESFWNKWDIKTHFENIFTITGYGSKKSTGKGVFNLEWEENFDFGIVPCKKNESLLLSRTILANNEKEVLLNARWKVQTKYGKLGEQKAFYTNPFKKPILQILPGSVLSTSFPYVGEMIKNTYADDTILDYQYGFLLTI